MTGDTGDGLSDFRMPRQGGREGRQLPYEASAERLSLVSWIQLTPDPPQRGKELTVSFRTTVSEVLDEGAYADVAVNIGLVKVLRKQYDLCEEARNLNTSIQCPAQQGEYYVEHTFDLAKTIPEAKFNIKVRGFTVKEEPLVCLDLVVDFIRRHD
ncbi:Phosphatidylglycerol/phosphatidylinositol transfer protein [Vanrija pseudolonga]|uniref:Phosphatidylglycerol/phosphatidylinositol transfer protein n=1 Tax=Vanrija pseudolonga TaxID=143232 RepID=A0AAF0Y089_9TREE|nr:Phosphatidylglycerol/phosphatidylinositol transfer protein [Vanrija pseudolonga]